MPCDESFTFKPIGFIESCYRQKFGTPRQPGLVKQATANLVFQPEYSKSEIFRGIEQFSHLWIIFVFHQSVRQNDKITVRPPRLGGKEKLGVFATRSNFRPNPIGQSVVRFEGVEKINDRYVLKLTGGDFLDGTPVLDVKPYIPFADSIADAIAGFASQPPDKCYQVFFSDRATQQIKIASARLCMDVKSFVSELLSYDPRPAFYDGKYEKTSFAMYLYDHNLQWELEGNKVRVMGFSSI